MSVAYGHGLYDRPPGELFQLKWDFDPTLLFFLVMLILYIRGLGHFKGRQPVAGWQKTLFFLGIGVMILALVPPIDPLSDQLFFAHMIQHMLITMVGVPLLLFGVPFFVTIRGAPMWFRRRIYFPLLRNRVIRVTNRFLQKPIVALLFFQFNFWFWHLPRYYNMALLNDAIHLVEHGMMAASSLYLWRCIIDPKPLRSPLPMPGRMIYLAMIMAANVILSAFLTFSDTVWYAYEGIPQPDWWKWGYLDDQHLGGLIMWIPGGVIQLIAMTAVFAVWAYGERKKDLMALEEESVGAEAAALNAVP